MLKERRPEEDNKLSNTAQTFTTIARMFAMKEMDKEGRNCKRRGGGEGEVREGIDVLMTDICNNSGGSTFPEERVTDKNVATSRIVRMWQTLPVGRKCGGASEWSGNKLAAGWSLEMSTDTTPFHR